MKIRIHQYLSRCGIFKRKDDIFSAIRNGRIEVNEREVRNPHFQFEPKKSTVFLDGEAIRNTNQNIYIVLNKPEKYLSSKLSPEDHRRKKRSVLELIKDTSMSDKTKNSLFCAGRLDEDTSGLLIITNDGPFASKMMGPRYNVKRTYDVVLQKPIDKKTAQKIEKGVSIDLEENGVHRTYHTRKCQVIIDPKDSKKVRMIMTEGKKREIRRIFEAVENKVKILTRTAIGDLSLRELKIRKGEYLFLDKKELEGKAFGQTIETRETDSRRTYSEHRR